MNVLTRSCIALLAGAIVFATSALAGPPIPPDSEQKAATAIRAAERMLGDPPYLYATFTSDGYNYGGPVSRALDEVTTPAALARTPGGVTLTCIGGGSFTAQSTPSAPRDIEIELHDCRPFRIFQGRASGPMRLTLISNSFSGGTIAGIRLGNADRDFVTTWTVPLPSETFYFSWRYKVDMQGRIGWMLQSQADMVPHLASIEINGTVDSVIRRERPGDPFPDSVVVRSVADHLFVATSITDGNDFNYLEELFDYQSGAITIESGPPATGSTRFDYAGLNFRRVTDFAASTESTELNGGVRYSSVNDVGASSCLGGEYFFRTKTPLNRPSLDYLAQDSGELVINRDVKARFYSAQNVPPGLPVPVNGMLVHVDLANGASFNYDAPGSISSGLPAPLPCEF